MKIPNAKTFSPQVLRTFASEICADDTEIFVELLGDCARDLRDQYSKLENTLAEKNWREFNRAAHTLKSTARTFGSPLVKELSLQLEAFSENGVEDSDLPELKESMKHLLQASKEFEDKIVGLAASPEAFLD